MKQSRRMLVRQWELARALGQNRHGVTVPQLVAETGTSRSTVYRDISVLRDAGVPIASEGEDGAARYRILGHQLPAIGLTALQIAALYLARAQLEPVAGTGLVDELDALLAKLKPPEAQQHFLFKSQPTGRPDLLRTIERALRSRRRARLEYRSASRAGATSVVHVEPLLLKVAQGEPYLLAFCAERGAERTYKLARIARIDLTDHAATYRPKRPVAAAFSHSLKAWSEEPQLVRIRLDRSIAWLAPEYPLPNQKLSTHPDGSVTIEALVAGTIEAKRWVLSWGGAAEALDPPELREATRQELATALAKYEKPGPAKAHREKSTGRGERRVTDRETGGV